MSDFASFVEPPPSEESEAELVRAASECLDWPAAGQHPADFFEPLRASGWHHTQYEAKEAVLASRDKVHFVVTYTRRSASDAVLSLHKNLWIVTRNSGTWGIAVRSYQEFCTAPSRADRASLTHSPSPAAPLHHRLPVFSPQCR